MGKITTLTGAAKFSQISQAQGKTVGLVVGGFDILHLGHVNLFRLAKKHSDVVIVGLDNDATIKLVKGPNRPINDLKRRSQVLADLTTIDKIFVIAKTSYHGSEEVLDSYKTLLAKIRPTHIFTHKTCDGHWLNKQRIAREHGIAFVLDRSPKITSSGSILEKLLDES